MTWPGRPARRESRRSRRPARARCGHLRLHLHRLDRDDVVAFLDHSRAAARRRPARRSTANGAVTGDAPSGTWRTAEAVRRAARRRGRTRPLRASAPSPPSKAALCCSRKAAIDVGVVGRGSACTRRSRRCPRSSRTRRGRRRSRHAVRAARRRRPGTTRSGRRTAAPTGSSANSPPLAEAVPDLHGAADELVAAGPLHAVDAQVRAADADRVLGRPGAGGVVLGRDQPVPRVERCRDRRAEVDVAEPQHQVARVEDGPVHVVDRVQAVDAADELDVPRRPRRVDAHAVSCTARSPRRVAGSSQLSGSRTVRDGTTSSSVGGTSAFELAQQPRDVGRP